MSEQNIAFKKFFPRPLAFADKAHELEMMSKWNDAKIKWEIALEAATAEANKRIAELEGEVAGWKESSKNWEKECYKNLEIKKQLQASNNRLREALQNILDGNYPSPRADRGKQCAHGKYYWEDCTNCIDDYIQTALSATPLE